MLSINESELRQFVLKSALSFWQRPVSEQVVCSGQNGAQIRLTKHGINLSYRGETAAYAHDPATRAVFESLRGATSE
jgi:hypothetical protein